MKKKHLLFRLSTVLLLLLFSFFAIYPFLYLLTASFVDDMSQVFKNGLNVQLSAQAMSLNNYKMLYTQQNGVYFSWFKNSISIALLYTTLSLVFSSMVGYGVSIYNFKGRRIYIIAIMSTMMIPVEIMMLPLYREMLTFKLINKYMGVVLPFAVSSFAIYFFMQYASTLPKDLVDAARVDGSGELRTFVQIMSPLMLPAFGTMGILQAMNSWNDFLWPLIVMSTNKNFTLPVGLQTYVTPYGNNYNMLFAGAVLSVIPMMIIFLFNQKSFISGLAIGSVKG